MGGDAIPLHAVVLDKLPGIFVQQASLQGGSEIAVNLILDGILNYTFCIKVLDAHPAALIFL